MRAMFMRASSNADAAAPCRRYDKFLLSGAVLLAAFLSFFHLGGRSVWYDEACSIAFSSLDWPGLWAVITHRETNMCFYYILLKGWLFLGKDEFTVRALSAFFAVGTVPIIYLTGKRLFDPRVGITAAWLISVNPFFIRYAQEARSYSLALLLVSASTYYLVKCVEENSKKNWALYVVISALAVYAHLFALLVLLSHALSIFFLRPGDINRRRAIGSAAVLSLCLLPFLFLVVTNDSGQVNWIPKFNSASLPNLFLALSGMKEKPIAIIYLFFFLFGLFSLFQRRRGDAIQSLNTWRCFLVFNWLVIPIVGVMLVSLIKPMFVARYFIISLPPLILLTSLGLANIRDSRAYCAALCITVIVSTGAVFRSNMSSEVEDWRGATRFIYSTAKPGDAAIFFLPYNKMAFEYYRAREHLTNDPLIYVFPSVTSLEMLMGRKTQPLNDALLNNLRRYDHRVWVVLCHEELRASVGELLQQKLGDMYLYIRKSDFGKIKLLLFYN